MMRFPSALLAAVLVCSSIAPTSAQARRGNDKCKALTGTTVAEFTTENCDSPVGLCTTGSLDAKFGALTGPFFLTVTEIELCDTDVLCYEGILLLEARGGTIVLQDIGTLDLATGAFSDVATQISGTRSFARRFVSLFFAGQAEGTTLHGTLSGTLCKQPRGQACEQAGAATVRGALPVR